MYCDVVYVCRLSRLSSGKTHDQASIAVLEKKLKEEEGGRQRVERELHEHLDQLQNLCSEEEVLQLKEQLSSRERELESMRKDIHNKRRQIERFQQELNVCHMSLQAVEKERTQLQISLNEESGMKMRLFKALSDLSRKHHTYVEELQKKNFEVDHLRQRIAEIMAIVPTIPTPMHPHVPPVIQSTAPGGINGRDVGYQQSIVTPFATTTTSAFQLVTTAESTVTFPSPQSPVSLPLSTAASGAVGGQLSPHSPGNQQLNN